MTLLSESGSHFMWWTPTTGLELCYSAGETFRGGILFMPAPLKGYQEGLHHNITIGLQANDNHGGRGPTGAVCMATTQHHGDKERSKALKYQNWRLEEENLEGLQLK